MNHHHENARSCLSRTQVLYVRTYSSTQQSSHSLLESMGVWMHLVECSMVVDGCPLGCVDSRSRLQNEKQAQRAAMRTITHTHTCTCNLNRRDRHWQFWHTSLLPTSTRSTRTGIIACRPLDLHWRLPSFHPFILFIRSPTLIHPSSPKQKAFILSQSAECTGMY